MKLGINFTRAKYETHSIKNFARAIKKTSHNLYNRHKSDWEISLTNWSQFQSYSDPILKPLAEEHLFHDFKVRNSKMPDCFVIFTAASYMLKIKTTIDE